MSGQDRCAERLRWLAAMVDGAGEAIIGVGPDGRVVSWNRGAERLFGHAEAEAVGMPAVAMAAAGHEAPWQAPRDEPGRPVQAVCRARDGGVVEISATSSPMRDRDGSVIGSVVVAREIATENRAQEATALLIADMHHHIRNLFTLAGSVVSLSASYADTPAELASRVRGRLVALSRANDLTLASSAHRRDDRYREVKLHALVRSIVASYGEPASTDGIERLLVTGADPVLMGNAVTHFALLLNELATNAAKYGALSDANGIVAVACALDGTELSLVWREQGGPSPEAGGEGFGSRFCRTIVTGHLGGRMTRSWTRQGLVIRLVIPLASLSR